MLTATALCLANTANAADSDSAWLTDLPAAQALAKAEHKVVLMDFTGSDWCPGCIELKKKVFDTKEFQTYAAQKLVLVLVDFPDKKHLPAALKKANDDLSARFNVDGFPTQVLLNPNGKEIARQTGYDGQSPREYIAWLEKNGAGK